MTQKNNIWISIRNFCVYDYKKNVFRMH